MAGPCPFAFRVIAFGERILDGAPLMPVAFVPRLGWFVKAIPCESAGGLQLRHSHRALGISIDLRHWTLLKSASEGYSQEACATLKNA